MDPPRRWSELEEHWWREQQWAARRRRTAQRLLRVVFVALLVFTAAVWLATFAPVELPPPASDLLVLLTRALDASPVEARWIAAAILTAAAFVSLALSRGLRSSLLTIIKATLLGGAVLYSLLVLFHFSNGFTLGRSLELPAQDVRMAVTCYPDPGTVWRFVNRKPGHDVGIERNLHAGIDVYAALCTGGLVGFQAQTPSTEASSGAASASAPLPLDLSGPVAIQTPTALTGDPLQELRLYLLDLINQDRARHGLPLVEMGDIPAAQEHAADMLVHSYISHWGTDGLKPYMRYTLAGGQGYEAENAFYLCYQAGGRGWRLAQEMERAQEALMESPGHRRNILDRWHKRVNIGVAYSNHALAIVQQFEGWYVDFAVPPVLQGTLLQMAGRAGPGVQLKGIQVWYEPSPRPLTRAQLLNTRAYSLGAGGLPVTFVRPPAPPGSFYPETETLFTYKKPLDPYKVSPGQAEPPDCPSFHTLDYADEAEALVPWVDASPWEMTGNGFVIQVDLGDAVDRFGRGVYTVVLWADIGGEPVRLTNYSLFW